MKPTRVGFVWDEYNAEVSSLLLRDLIDIKDECALGLEVVMSAEAYRDCSGVLDSLMGGDASVTVSHDTNPDSVLLWMRYTVKDRVLIKVEPSKIVDRDLTAAPFQESQLEVRDVQLTAPHQSGDRPSRITHDPAVYPMPNPYARPWFNYASVSDAIITARLRSTKR